MTSEVAVVEDHSPRKIFPSEIPKKHCTSNDARIQWLWQQRFAVVRIIFARTRDIQTRMACTTVLMATAGANLSSIELVLKRLEGGAVSDAALVEKDGLQM